MLRKRDLTSLLSLPFYFCSERIVHIRLVSRFLPPFTYTVILVQILTISGRRGRFMRFTVASELWPPVIWRWLPMINPINGKLSTVYMCEWRGKRGREREESNQPPCNPTIVALLPTDAATVDRIFPGRGLCTQPCTSTPPFFLRPHPPIQRTSFS